MNTKIPEKALLKKAEFNAKIRFNDPQKRWDYVRAFIAGADFLSLYLDIKDLRAQQGKSMKGVRL